MDNIKLIEHKKIRICCDDEKQSIEIGRESINNGFLKSLPGPSLPVFLYLLTHLDNENTIKTNPALMAGFLALDREKINEGLDILKNNKFIKIEKNKHGDYRYSIKINLNKLVDKCYTNFNENNEKLNDYRKKVLNTSKFDDNDLFKALMSFLPNDIDNSLIEDEINHWINDFDIEMIRELIRRVDKWSQNNNKSNKESFYYLHGIVDDWYSKKIFSYERLKYFDRMYRETNELAKCYGLKNWYNVSESQMEIFYNWLNENNGINLSLAKFAIKEAFKRKSDGQPSLKYIEDNFIDPLKESNVKNIHQAKKILNGNNKNEKDSGIDNNTNNWETFEWDIEDLN